MTSIFDKTIKYYYNFVNSETFMAPIKEQPVYYAIVAIILLIIWALSSVL